MKLHQKEFHWNRVVVIEIQWLVLGNRYNCIQYSTVSWNFNGVGCSSSGNGNPSDRHEWILYLLESWFLRRLLSFRAGIGLDNKPFRFFAVKLNRQLLYPPPPRSLILGLDIKEVGPLLIRVDHFSSTDRFLSRKTKKVRYFLLKVSIKKQSP